MIRRDCYTHPRHEAHDAFYRNHGLTEVSMVSVEEGAKLSTENVVHEARLFRRSGVFIFHRTDGSQ